MYNDGIPYAWSNILASVTRKDPRVLAGDTLFLLVLAAAVVESFCELEGCFRPMRGAIVLPYAQSINRGEGRSCRPIDEAHMPWKGSFEQRRVAWGATKYE